MCARSKRRQTCTAVMRWDSDHRIRTALRALGDESCRKDSVETTVIVTQIACSPYRPFFRVWRSISCRATRKGVLLHRRCHAWRHRLGA